jgi:hypothetical protein
MNTEEAAKIISKVRPKLAIIQHFGMLMVKAGEDKEAKWIEEQTGVKTIAAKDGMSIDLETGRMERAGKTSKPSSRDLDSWVVKPG